MRHAALFAAVLLTMGSIACDRVSEPLSVPVPRDPEGLLAAPEKESPKVSTTELTSGDITPATPITPLTPAASATESLGAGD